MRAGVIGAAALCVSLLACGKSMRNDYDSHGPGDASSDVPDADADATPANCAYPRAGTPDPAILAKVAELARTDCQYRLGPETELPFGPGLGQVAFSFDVNGDQIGDIFFRDGDVPFGEQSAPPQGPRRLRLALSSANNGSIVFVPTDCDALAAIPDGRVFPRDLDSDGVPDLVVSPTAYYLDSPDFECPPAVGMALQAFLNLPEGFVEVLRHEWPETTDSRGCPFNTTLLDVEVGDFGGASDDIADIAFGFELVPAISFGVTVAQIDAVPPAQAYRVHHWLDRNDFSPRLDLTGTAVDGLLAAGGDPSAPWLFLLERPSTGPEDTITGRVLRVEGDGLAEQPVELEVPPLDSDYFGPHAAWGHSFAGLPDVLALSFERAVAFYDISSETAGPIPMLASFPTVWGQRRGEPLGAGLWGTMAHRFMMDVDGDGDVDFVQRGFRSEFEPGGEAHFLTLYRGEPDGSFGAPVTAAASRDLDRIEPPFVQIGTASGAIVVNMASGPYDIDGSAVGPPTFQMLECAPE